MRIDLIPERDRFIPGWHTRPEPQGAEQTAPATQWSVRPAEAFRAILSKVMQVYASAKSAMRNGRIA
jgi:hypothetical protein